MKRDTTRRSKLRRVRLFKRPYNVAGNEGHLTANPSGTSERQFASRRQSPRAHCSILIACEHYRVLTTPAPMSNYMRKVASKSMVDDNTPFTAAAHPSTARSRPACSPPCRQSEHECQRVFEVTLERCQPARTNCAVDGAVVGAERDLHDLRDLETTLLLRRGH